MKNMNLFEDEDFEIGFMGVKHFEYLINMQITSMNVGLGNTEHIREHQENIPI